MKIAMWNVIKQHRRDLIIALAALAGQALYVISAVRTVGRFGYPLDDAWIHQVYARNLAAGYGWSFVAGQPSTGSTSILWTLLIAPAYLLRIDPFWWTQALGAVALMALALGASRLVEESNTAGRWAVGLAVALEWHLIWAAASGMETALFAAALMWLWVWVRHCAPEAFSVRQGVHLGLWGGILMLIRPEGIVAAGMAGLAMLVKPGMMRERLTGVLAALGGLCLLVIPFLSFNYSVSGSVWPNTFSAKQTEYAALLALPMIQRILDQIGVVLVGTQVLLLPGLIAFVIRRARSRPADLVPLGWSAAHLLLYALRLPVIYQHGRYAIPAMPVIVALSVIGTLELARWRDPQAAIRVLSRAWLGTAAALVIVIPILLGAPAYVRDVDFIQNEMVATAKWLNTHTSQDAVLAIHDIGAVGYYAPRHLVDLAGLISPQVIPRMNDSNTLREFILQSGADYVVIFPHWSAGYETIADDPALCRVWSADQVEGYSAASPSGPMTVYQVGGCHP
jgi:hypothetical protein